MSQPKPQVAVLKTGNTYPSIKEEFGDFDQWFLRGLSSELDITVFLMPRPVSYPTIQLIGTVLW